MIVNALQRIIIQIGDGQKSKYPEWIEFFKTKQKPCKNKKKHSLRNTKKNLQKLDLQNSLFSIRVITSHINQSPHLW
jgi:hypothetical protein